MSDINWNEDRLVDPISKLQNAEDLCTGQALSTPTLERATQIQLLIRMSISELNAYASEIEDFISERIYDE